MKHRKYPPVVGERHFKLPPRPEDAIFKPKIWSEALVAKWAQQLFDDKGFLEKVYGIDVQHMSPAQRKDMVRIRTLPNLAKIVRTE